MHLLLTPTEVVHRFLPKKQASKFLIDSLQEILKAKHEGATYNLTEANVCLRKRGTSFEVLPGKPI